MKKFEIKQDKLAPIDKQRDLRETLLKHGVTPTESLLSDLKQIME